MKEIPFRWNLTHRNHLGKLIEGEREPNSGLNPGEEFFQCCARIVAFSEDSDLVFVGRSPESIFDYLSGLFFDSEWFERLTLLHFSMRFQDENKIREEYPGAIGAMREYMSCIGLHPESIATRERSIDLVDLVLSGDTFGRLVNFLYNWTNEIKFDWKAVKRRLRLIGITERTKTSPNTWRWQQHSKWISLVGTRAVKNVSIPYGLWTYLGDYQEKVSHSYPPWRWGDPELSAPSYSRGQLIALKSAYDLFELGRNPEKREQFAALLAKESAMKHAWFRDLVMDLRS